jgi:NADPH-dependent ferric siderophore reductase
MARVRKKLLESIDARLARSDELWERSERAFQRFIEADERSKEAFEQNKEAFDRNTRAFNEWKAQQEDYREFMRELTLRAERSSREMIAAFRRHEAAMMAEFAAQRGAFLAILDRLPPAGSGSTG